MHLTTSTPNTSAEPLVAPMIYQLDALAPVILLAATLNSAAMAIAGMSSLLKK
jgi:hypothetical protein